MLTIQTLNKRLTGEVRQILIHKIAPHYVYHNLVHTEYVIEAVAFICQFESVTGKELELLTLAALMHDLGYVYGHQAHELQGAIMARKLMTEAKYSLMDIEIVQGLIMATIMPQKPQTKLQKILCDADLFHLSQP